MNLYNSIRSVEFLAPELLTWLVYRCDAGEGYPLSDLSVTVATIPGLKLSEIELYLDDSVKLEAPVFGLTVDSYAKGSVSNSPGMFHGLYSGKLVTDAKFKLIYDDREWLFSLRAPDLDIRSAKLPQLLTKGTDDRDLERFILIEQLEEILDTLIEAFLLVRSDSERWDVELQEIREWIRDRCRNGN